MNLFEQFLKLPAPKESNFDMSHPLRTDMKIGELTPVLFQEMMPGDVINIDVNSLLKTAPLVTPCFGSLRLQIDHFFVPNRIIWNHWQDFVLQKPNAEIPYVHSWLYNWSPPMDADTSIFAKLRDNTDFQLSQSFINGYSTQIIKIGGLTSNIPLLNIVRPGTLAQYIGLPVGFTTTAVDPITGGYGTVNEQPINLFRVLAYNWIWYEWYRNTQENGYLYSIDEDGDSHPFTDSDIEDILNTSKDYVGCLNPTDIDDVWSLDSNTARSLRWLFTLKHRCLKHDYISSVLNSEEYDKATARVTIANNSFTVNQFRTATRVDKFLKRRYLGGNRYIEQIRAQFGVIDSDSRLQRPQLLSSSSSPIVFTDVVQTAETAQGKLGDMASKGVAINNQNETVRFRSTEHGIYVVMASIVPIVDDSNGIDPFLQKLNDLDYYKPALDNIEMQPLAFKEISATDDYMKYLASLNSSDFYHLIIEGENVNQFTSWLGRLSGSSAAIEELDVNLYDEFNKGVGYLPAWAEYKTRLNRVAGQLSYQFKDWVLLRPNPRITEFETVGNSDYFYPKMSAIPSEMGMENSYIYTHFLEPSQYVLPEDYNYLWADTTDNSVTNFVQFYFNYTMRRPMSKWSMPL